MSRAVEQGPGDPAHAERVLLARPATVNQQILLYVTQALEADARRSPRPATTEIHELGTRLRELDEAFQDHSGGPRPPVPTTAPPGEHHR